MSGWQPEPDIRPMDRGFRSDAMFVRADGGGWVRRPEISDLDPVHDFSSDPYICSLGALDDPNLFVSQRLRDIRDQPGGERYLSSTFQPGRHPHHEVDRYAHFSAWVSWGYRQPYGGPSTAGGDPLVELCRRFARYRDVPLPRGVTMGELIRWTELDPAVAHPLIMEGSVAVGDAVAMRRAVPGYHPVYPKDYVRVLSGALPLDWFLAQRAARSALGHD